LGTREDEKKSLPYELLWVSMLGWGLCPQGLIDHLMLGSE